MSLAFQQFQEVRMTSLKKLLIITSLSLLSADFILAQAEETGFRSEASLRYKLKGKWSIQPSFKYRLQAYRSNYIYAFEVQKKINKKHAISMEYQFLTNSRRNALRYFIQYKRTWKINKFDLSSVAKIQINHSLHSSERWSVNNHEVYFRPEFQMIYPVLKKINWKLSVEPFWTMVPRLDFYRMRYEGGFEFDLKKWGNVDASMFFQQDRWMLNLSSFICVKYRIDI